MSKLKEKLSVISNALNEAYIYTKTKIGIMLKPLNACLVWLEMLNLYTTCYKFPLYRYIDASCGNYKGYKKSFLPVRASTIKKASEKIYNEYLSLTSNNAIKNKISETNKIERLRTRLIVLVNFQTILNHRDSEIVRDEMKRMGYSAKTKERALKELQNAQATIKLNLDEAIEGLKENKQEEKPATKADYLKKIQLINDNEGYEKLNLKSTVAEYILAIDLLTEKQKRYADRNKVKS